jgi:hypothetical protein
MKKITVINTYPGEEKNRHEYNIIEEVVNKGVKYSLMRSYAEHWNEDYKGTKACSILNTGDGFIFSKNIDCKNLDYALAAEIHILMTFINKRENDSLFSGIIEISEVENTFFI